MSVPDKPSPKNIEGPVHYLNGYTLVSYLTLHRETYIFEGEELLAIAPNYKTAVSWLPNLKIKLFHRKMEDILNES